MVTQRALGGGVPDLLCDRLLLPESSPFEAPSSQEDCFSSVTKGQQVTEVTFNAHGNTVSSPVHVCTSCVYTLHAAVTLANDSSLL